MTRLLNRRRPAPAERHDRHDLRHDQRERRRYRGRHRHPRTFHPARYAAIGLLAVSGHPGAGLAPTRTATRAAARPVAATTRTVAHPRRVSRSAPVRALPARYVLKTVDGQVLTGRATWYGPGFAGHRTANGETFDPRTDLTAAHRWLPFGTLLRVCRGQRCVVVRINDRGPFGAAILDLSFAAADRLGLVRTGIAEVTATVLTTERVRVPA
jgi:rare lipoprotein A (peptidoglycan hydrolase)